MGSSRCSQLLEYVEQISIFPDFDYYISANIFSSTERSYEKLLAICNLVIDIDCHKECHPDLLAQRIQTLAWRLKNDLFDCGDLPMPRCIVFTGRGAQIWWCVVPAYGPKFIGTFKHIEQHFASKIDGLIAEFPSELQDFCVDHVASSNAAGLFRLPGTINTHCQRQVMVNFFTGPRLDLKDFRDRFLPAKIQNTQAETKSSHFRSHKQSVPTGILLQRLSAIERLRYIRDNSIGEETRNNLCFAYYVAAKPLYGDSKAYQLTQNFNAGFKQPFTDQELKGCLQSARRKDYTE